MYKHSFYGLLTIMMVAMMSVAVASCSKDEEEEAWMPTTVYDVDGQTELFEEPYLQYGASKADVKEKLQGYEIIDETAELLQVAGKKAGNRNLYFFENDQLVEAAAMLYSPQTVSSFQTIINQYYDRYTSNATIDGGAYQLRYDKIWFHSSAYIFLIGPLEKHQWYVDYILQNGQYNSAAEALKVSKVIEML